MLGSVATLIRTGTGAGAGVDIFAALESFFNFFLSSTIDEDGTGTDKDEGVLDIQDSKYS
jgi:hypothetical protein